MPGLVYYRDKETGELVSRSMNSDELAALDSNAIPSPIVPDSITPRQLRLALVGAGISLDAITTALEGNDFALIEWEYSSEFRRDHPMVSAIGGQLGMSEDQIDDLFIQSATI